MTVAFVQALKGSDTSGSSVSSISTGTGSGFGSGNYIVGFVNWYNNGSAQSQSDITVTDGTNTYPIINFFDTDTGCALFYGPAHAGATTITVNFNGITPSFVKVTAHEVSGVYGVVDGYSQAATFNISSTSCATPSITTAAAGDYIYAVLCDDNENLGSSTVSSPFTLKNDTLNAQHDAYDIQSTAGAISATFTVTNTGANVNYVGAIIALSPQKTVALDSTATSPWTLPTDWPGHADAVYVIGAGGNGSARISSTRGGTGGGGGACVSVTSSYTISSNPTFSIGAVGSAANTTFNSSAFIAAAGATGTTTTAGAGGTTASSTVPTGGTKVAGGSGRLTPTSTASGGGGGGAGGPNGAGVTAASNVGGNGDNGTTVAPAAGTNGTAGSEWTATAGGTYGAGSGASGWASGTHAGTVGGQYGGGGSGASDGSTNAGGNGGGGLVVIIYTPGTSSASGSLSETFIDLTLSGTGAAIAKASLSETFADLTLAGTAKGIGKGALAETFSNLTLTGTASAFGKGVLSETYANLTLTGTASAPGKGSLSETFANFTLSGAANSLERWDQTRNDSGLYSYSSDDITTLNSATGTTANTYETIVHGSGKWVASWVLQNISVNAQVGFGAASAPSTSGYFLGKDALSFGYSSGGNGYINNTVNTTNEATTSFGSGDQVDIAIDITNKVYWIRSTTHPNWNGNASFTPGDTNGFGFTSLTDFNLYPGVHLQSNGSGAATAQIVAPPTIAGFSAWGTLPPAPSGTLSETFADLTLAGTAKAIGKGTLTETFTDLTLSGTAQAPGKGLLSETYADFILASSGKGIGSGTLSETYIDLTLAATAVAIGKGTLTETFSDLTLTGAAVAIGKGSLSETFTDLTLAGIASTASKGTLNESYADLTLAATASAPGKGSLSETYADLTLSGTGKSIASGTLSETYSDLTLSGSGHLAGSASHGTLSETYADLTLAGSGKTFASATLSETFVDFTLAGTGHAAGLPSGVLSETFVDLTLSGSGRALRVGSLAETYADLTLAASGKGIAKATFAETFSDLTLAATGSFSAHGTLSETFPRFVLSGTGAGTGAVPTLIGAKHTQLPPVMLNRPQGGGIEIWAGQIARTLNQMLTGRLNATAPITLASGATSTVLTDSRIGPATHVTLSPLSANAASALASGQVWFAPTHGSVTINHPSSAAVDQTFGVLLIG